MTVVKQSINSLWNDTIYDNMETKRCSYCEKILDVNKFHRLKNGYHSYCKLCRKDYTKNLQFEKRKNLKYPRNHWEIDETEENLKEVKTLLGLLGYDTNKNIHEQFLERHNL